MKGPGVRRDRGARLLASLPGPAQELVRLVYVAARVTQGPRSFLTYVRLSRIRRHVGSGGRVVRMRLRPLAGRTIRLRPSTSDVDTVWGTFAGKYHLPPSEAGEVSLVWDLGANIGLTMADVAERHPRARIVGMEMDAENAALARGNLAPWAERCEVIEAAAWPWDGELRYVRLDGATAGHSVTDAPPEANPSVTRVTAISLASLLARGESDRPVDFVKVDVEGAERELLRENTRWATRVRTISVEVHEPYTVDECQADLRALGFRTRVDPRHWACVIGFRGS